MVDNHTSLSCIIEERIFIISLSLEKLLMLNVVSNNAQLVVLNLDPAKYGYHREILIKNQVDSSVRNAP